jgi:hypothetical protein
MLAEGYPDVRMTSENRRMLSLLGGKKIQTTIKVVVVRDSLATIRVANAAFRECDPETAVAQLRSYRGLSLSRPLEHG